MYKYTFSFDSLALTQAFITFNPVYKVLYISTSTISPPPCLFFIYYFFF